MFKIFHKFDNFKLLLSEFDLNLLCDDDILLDIANQYACNMCNNNQEIDNIEIRDLTSSK